MKSDGVAGAATDSSNHARPSRTGGPAFNQVFGAPLFDYYNSHPEAGRVSATTLSSLSVAENAAIVGACNFPACGTVVDVGGGQGSLLAAILKANPGLHGVLLERPGMAALARANFEASLDNSLIFRYTETTSLSLGNAGSG
jgi:hypothetical protein